jgi:site-specific recombinase XerD
MTMIDSVSTTVERPGVAFEIDEAQLAAVSFLARYSGRTLEAYRHDLRGYFQWASDNDLAVLNATRPHIELFRACLEDRGLAASTTGASRRCAASIGLLTSTGGSDPTQPSTFVGPRFTRPMHAAWTVRSSGCSCARRSSTTTTTRERACATNIEDLEFERGHRTLRIIGKGNKPATIPLVPRTARTVDLAVGEQCEGPILQRRDGQRLDRRTAHRWVRSIGKRAGLGLVHPHMLRAAFIMAALDAGVPLRDVQLAARHADPRTTTIYDRRRQNFDRHAAYVVVAFVADG